eukprot:scaffold404_cov101-Isochrysis_galbana.AAC.7
MPGATDGAKLAKQNVDGRLLLSDMLSGRVPAAREHACAPYRSCSYGSSSLLPTPHGAMP